MIRVSEFAKTLNDHAAISTTQQFRFSDGFEPGSIATDISDVLGKHESSNVHDCSQALCFLKLRNWQKKLQGNHLWLMVNDGE